MPEQTAELQRINWASCFAFTRLFGTFRLAIQPSKLLLALAGIILMGIWGWILDGIWRPSYEPLEAEVRAFWQRPDIDTWREDVLRSRSELIAAGYFNATGEALPEATAKLAQSDPDEAIEQVLDDLENRYATVVATPAERPAIARRYAAASRLIAGLRRSGVFKEFMQFETEATGELVRAAASFDLFGGLDRVAMARRGPAADLASPVLGPEQMDPGVLASLFLMARGVQWLLSEHIWFAVLFLLGSLAIWSLLGGAICRTAALDIAREERIPIKAGLSFARRKFVGFLTAPLLPIGLVLGVGILLLIGGWVSAIPYFGDILLALGVPLVLAAGFIIALVVVGALGGGSLMWPTIAVEGSDSFDAMSRSYSYVYSRPWKALWYGLVALIYGSLCYLFLRFFVLLMLRGSRFFLGLGLAATDRPGAGAEQATKLDVIWPTPTFDLLLRPVALPMAREGWDVLAAALIFAWVLVTVLLLCAFLVSFYFCASTMIYYLLRREVDATDVEDVYMEDGDMEPEPQLAGVTVGSAPAAPATAVAEPPATVAPAVPPPASSQPSPPAEPS
ncbi:MAG: hypothetical protein AMXMBFR13_19430 [Phycisphaerae bacterium]